MKIKNKGNEPNSFETKPKKHRDFDFAKVRNAIIAIGGLSIIIIVIFGVNWSQVKQKIDYETSGWTYKYETKSYPVSKISIKNEYGYYTDDQTNAGYALANYKTLRDKDMTIAVGMIKQNALENYIFNVDEIDYSKTDLANLNFDDYYHNFTEIIYKKGIKEPEAKVYYRLKYHHGKLESKKLKSDATLVLPE